MTMATEEDVQVRPESPEERAAAQAQIAQELAALGDGRDAMEKAGIHFEWGSVNRKSWTIYDALTGAKVEVPEFVGKWAMKQRIWYEGKVIARFSPRPVPNPPIKPGQVKCFLHAESEFRETLNHLGINGRCRADHIQNMFAMEQHAKGKHPAEWRMYTDFQERQEREAERDARREEVSAMRDLAQAAMPKRTTGKAE